MQAIHLIGHALAHQLRAGVRHGQPQLPQAQVAPPRPHRLHSLGSRSHPAPSLAEADKRVRRLRARLKGKDFGALRRRWEAKEAYATDAYRLITNKELCLKCHEIGKVQIEGPQGPNRALAAVRLRPEWAGMFISHPKRLFTYTPVMPQNFPNDPDPLKWGWQQFFVGSPLASFLTDPSAVNIVGAIKYNTSGKGSVAGIKAKGKYALTVKLVTPSSLLPTLLALPPTQACASSTMTKSGQARANSSRRPSALM